MAKEEEKVAISNVIFNLGKGIDSDSRKEEELKPDRLDVTLHVSL